MANRKNPTVFLILLTASLCCAAERPNIVFLMTDDQTTYSMGCYGNPDVQTPNLDRLAKDGIVFDRHYATTAICMASRATVMTGMYEFKTGCNFLHGDMQEATWKKSYPVLLREAGYTTGFAGKFGFDLMQVPNGERLPLPVKDFDKWGGGPGQTSYVTAENKSMAAYSDEFPHSTLSYGAFAHDFIRESVDSKKPFCLSISFKAPHKPAIPDPRFDDVYRGKSFRKPENFGRDAGIHFAAQSKVDRQYERFFSWNYADKYDEVMANYHQQIYGVDAALGMLRNALEEHGVAKNTVIIYTSDNGYFCGSHGYGSKVLPYEESSRVPLIVYDPRHANSHQGIRCGALSGLVDVAPTLLRLAEVSVPEKMDGGDLMELYANPNGLIHDALPLINVWGHPATHALAVVTKEMKYIYWCFADDGMHATEELYHLGKDALEMTNRAGHTEDQAALTGMRRRYDALVERWKVDSVPYHFYREYGTIFDRAVSWEDKVDAYPPHMKKGEGGRRKVIE